MVALVKTGHITKLAIAPDSVVLVSVTLYLLNVANPSAEGR